MARVIPVVPVSREVMELLQKARAGLVQKKVWIKDGTGRKGHYRMQWVKPENDSAGEGAGQRGLFDDDAIPQAAPKVEPKQEAKKDDGANGWTDERMAQRYMEIMREKTKDPDWGRESEEAIKDSWKGRIIRAIREKDAYGLEFLANGLNEGGKRLFEEVTGQKLPKGQKATWDAIRKWAGVSEESHKSKVASDDFEFAKKQFSKNFKEQSEADKFMGMLNVRFDEGFTELSKINGKTMWLNPTTMQGMDLNSAKHKAVRDYVKAYIAYRNPTVPPVEAPKTPGLNADMKKKASGVAKNIYGAVFNHWNGLGTKDEALSEIASALKKIGYEKDSAVALADATFDMIVNKDGFDKPDSGKKIIKELAIGIEKRLLLSDKKMDADGNKPDAPKMLDRTQDIQALGVAKITDVGEENVYVEKDGKEYFFKPVGQLDKRYKVGEYDFSKEDIYSMPSEAPKAEEKPIDATPAQHDIARNLLYDLGREGAIRYAEKIAGNQAPLSGDYAIAARILKEMPAVKKSLFDTFRDGLAKAFGRS